MTAPHAKRIGVLLALSLAANAILVVAIAARPTLVPARVRQWAGWRVEPRATADKATAERRPAPSARPLWSTLESADLRTFVQRLRAAGFSARLIRDLIRYEVGARYDAQMAALQETDPTTPFWKIGPTSYTDRVKKNEEYTRLQRERASVIRELLDDPFFTDAESQLSLQRQFGSLAPEKIKQVQKIEDDYADMISGVRAATNGVFLREDREKIAFLEREKQSDLAAVLSRAELGDYTLRSSVLTKVIADNLGEFRPNEAEFRAVYAMQQQLNDRFPIAYGISSENFGKRQEVLQELNAELKRALGDQRYATYARETSEEYVQLQRALERENRPLAAAVQAFDLRESVSTQSVRIVDDPVLTVEQKREVLAALAQNTRNQLLATLGSTAGKTYVAQINGQWLNAVESGSAVTFTGPATRTMGRDNVMVSLGAGATLRSLSYRAPRP